MPSAPREPQHEVVIVGGGFSGIGAGILLDKAGFADWVILEEGDGVGGAWHWNTYPGVAVDIPSFSYQFTFEPSTRWSRTYAPGAELKAYAEHCVDRYGLRDRIRLRTQVTALDHDEADDLWRVSTADGGTLTSRHVINATGVLTKPRLPDIPGVEDFRGDLVHTARWDPDLVLTDRRVAVIGTGASAVQLVPAIAEQARHLVVFQRTPVWCLPKLDLPLPRSARAVLRHLPGARPVSRALSQTYVEVTFPLAAHFHRVVPTARVGQAIGRRFLRRQVRDPEVRAKLTPQYALGCKRPTFHNSYLSTFNRHHVLLETDPIERVTSSGVRTGSGLEHPVDVLVLATGFKVFERDNMPGFAVRAGGVELGDWWDQHRFQAYQGVSVPGFPNLFTILGPYGYNGSSYFNLIEHQMRHILRCLTHARATGASRIEISRDAHDRYFERMLARRGRQIFFAEESCGLANSYYFDRHGDAPFRNSTTPGAAWASAHFDLGDYQFATPAPAGV